MRILVADDDRDAVLVLTMLLEDEGYQVRGVHHGTEVLDAVFNFAPDVVLLDIGMPQMSGYEVARRLRERREQLGRHHRRGMVSKQRAVFAPGLGRRFRQRTAHRKEQLRRLACDLVKQIERHRDHDES